MFLSSSSQAAVRSIQLQTGGETMNGYEFNNDNDRLPPSSPLGWYVAAGVAMLVILWILTL